MKISKNFETKIRFYDIYLSDNNPSHNNFYVDCLININKKNSFDKISLTFQWYLSKNAENLPCSFENSRLNPFSKYDGKYINFMNGFNIKNNKITTGLIEILIMNDEQILHHEDISEKNYIANSFAQEYRENILFSLIQWAV